MATSFAVNAVCIRVGKKLHGTRLWVPPRAFHHQPYIMLRDIIITAGKLVAADDELVYGWWEVHAVANLKSNVVRGS